MSKNRYISPGIISDLNERKMAFIGGPRQIGKTTFALSLLKNATEESPAYLNWDNIQKRSLLLKGELPPHQSLVILDEIHKYARWRGLVKGFYDTHKNSVSFVVTGSARLDYYRRGGDSLQGRYHYHRLHPFSLPELAGLRATRVDLESLLRFGGFPEPLFRSNEKFWRRWQKERLERVIHEDLRDLEHVREVSLIELLLEHLPNCVGSPLSVKSLRELMQVSHESVERWITILENLYVCFRIVPFGSPKIRAVKKERKLYFWDWTQSPDGGARFENLVASHLLKYCHFLEDTEGYRMELRFIRDTDRREVDFVVLQDKKPLFAVECKTGEARPGPSIHYFRERTSIPKFYQVHLGEKDTGNAETSVRILPFAKFCAEVGIP